MYRIHLIVWSKDRACQLHLLLASLARYLPQTFTTSIIYRSTTEKYEEAYEILRKSKVGSIQNEVVWFREIDFYDDTKFAIECNTFDYVCFATDDTAIFKNPPKRLSPSDLGTGVFSFRLGLNTTLQDCFNGVWQPPLNLPTEEGEIISWDWTQYHAHYNYGYPCALDMHVFPRKLVSSLITDEFHNTNQLESMMFYNRELVPPIMKSFKHSIAVNIPMNNISGVTKATGISLEGLNDKFLAGYRFDLDSLAKTPIVGCHQEISLELKNGSHV